MKLKKVLIALLLTTFFISCQKEKQVCYDCTFGTFNGTQRPPTVWCGKEGEPIPQFTDDNGNDLSVFCRRR
jgi:hypothetical protein